jgi:glycine cleavage system pyridoxal-binding protein P
MEITNASLLDEKLVAEAMALLMYDLEIKRK